MFCAGACVVNVYINYEKKFAFVELRTGSLLSVLPPPYQQSPLLTRTMLVALQANSVDLFHRLHIVPVGSSHILDSTATMTPYLKDIETCKALFNQMF